jgi:acetyltransferase
VSACPAAFEEHAVLADGTRIFLRPLRPEDAPLLQDLLAHMSEEDRRLRFFAPIRELPEGLRRQLTQVDYKERIALLAFNADDGTILGVVRLAGLPQTKRAEFAVALRSDWKGRGLGWLLMQRMLDLAARLGFAEVFGYVLRDNQRMLEMCREMGFIAAPAPGDAESLIVRRAVSGGRAP